MGERFLEDSEVRAPISSEPLPSAQEIRDKITEIVEKYSGDELIDRLTDYLSLSMIEIYLQKDPTPNRLELLKPEKIQTLQFLAPGIMPKPEGE